MCDKKLQFTIDTSLHEGSRSVVISTKAIYTIWTPIATTVAIRSHNCLLTPIVSEGNGAVKVANNGTIVQNGRLQLRKLGERTVRHVQLLQHFQARWKREYLTSLRETHRASGTNKQGIRIGDVVLIHDDKPRLTWRLAIIEDQEWMGISGQ